MIDKLPDIPLNKFTKVKKDNKKIKINKNTPPPQATSNSQRATEYQNGIHNIRHSLTK